MKKNIGTIDAATELGLKKAELTAVITRADGTVEDLGVIAETDYSKKNILQKLGERLCRMF